MAASRALRSVDAWIAEAERVLPDQANYVQTGAGEQSRLTFSCRSSTPDRDLPGTAVGFAAPFTVQQPPAAVIVTNDGGDTWTSP
jgi:hypothetical protein